MRRILAILLCLLLLPMCAAAAPENGYVAKIKPVQTFSAAAAENAVPEFITIDDLATAEEYLAMGLIEYFEIDQPVYLMESTQSEVYWQHTMVNLPAAWEKQVTGRGVLVGILDSGVYPHVDFGSNLIPGYNVLDASNPDDTTDNLGHGTRVAGMVAAASNGFGAVGAAPAASLMPIKCFDDGVTTGLNHIAEAIKAAVLGGCKIINLSLGFRSYSQTVADAIAYAVSNGVIPVAAAGNKADGYALTDLCYPAAYDGVVGVSAVTETKERATYAHYNESVDITAPGNCLGSTNYNGGYMTTSHSYSDLNGTSFSAPIISGILALGMEVAPTLSPTLLENALFHTAEDLGTDGWDSSFGYGLADAGAFVEELTKMDHTHLLRTSRSISIYRTNYGTARIIFAQYEADNKLASIFHMEDLTLPAGYSAFSVSNIPANTRVFLFDGMRPLGKPLYY